MNEQIWKKGTSRFLLEESASQQDSESTGRTQLEKALRKSHQLLETLFMTLEEAVLIIEPEAYTVILYNPSTERTFGYHDEEMFGKPLHQLYEDQSTYARFEEDMLHALHAHEVFRAEARMRHKDGKSILTDQTATAIEDTEGNRTGIVLIVRDITERSQIRVALQEAKEAAEAASKTKSLFLASMSHELRTPLNAIIGFSNMLRQHPDLSSEHQYRASLVYQSGQHLLSLINDVLDISKLETGRIAIQPREFDLYSVLDGLKQMFSLRAAEKHLHLSMTHTAGVPRYIRTDLPRLRQILVHLLSNAVKFTQEGKVELHVRTCPEQEDAKRPSDITLQFSISDTGPGISQDEFETLFEAFVQSRAEKGWQEGAGLGLAICYQFAQLLGGELDVESQIGKGSAFTFTLPCEIPRSSQFHPEHTFRYSADTQGKGIPPREKSSGEAFASVPQDILKALKKAAISGEMDEIDQLIEQIRSYNADAADTLTAFAEEFEYAKIARLIQEQNG